MKLPRMVYYYCDEHGTPVATDDIMVWSEYFHKKERIVKQETIGGSRISTVFLGIDHGLGKVPVLWETMIFSDESELDDYQDRCAGNREQAEAMHQKAVDMVNQFYKKNT